MANPAKPRLSVFAHDLVPPLVASATATTRRNARPAALPDDARHAAKVT
jgi:hypothetical protein